MPAEYMKSDKKRFLRKKLDEKKENVSNKSSLYSMLYTLNENGKLLVCESLWLIPRRIKLKKKTEEKKEKRTAHSVMIMNYSFLFDIIKVVKLSRVKLSLFLLL